MLSIVIRIHKQEFWIQNHKINLSDKTVNNEYLYLCINCSAPKQGIVIIDAHWSQIVSELSSLNTTIFLHSYSLKREIIKRLKLTKGLIHAM